MTYTSNNTILRTSNELDLDLLGLTIIHQESLPCASQRTITYPKKNEITNTHQNRIRNQYKYNKLLTSLQCEFQNYTQNTVAKQFLIEEQCTKIGLNWSYIYPFGSFASAKLVTTTHQSKNDSHLHNTSRIRSHKKYILYLTQNLHVNRKISHVLMRRSDTCKPELERVLC